MADYTPFEIQNAVEKIVRSAIRRPYGALGNRQLGITFGDYQEAAAGILTLYQNAPFYVVSLGANRIREFITTEKATAEQLIDLVQGTNRRVKTVTNISPLSNSSVALAQLESAVSSRTNAFNDIESVPAFKRFEQNTQKFLDESSSAIRSNGSVVPTPEESRNQIGGVISSLEEQHRELVRRIRALNVSIDDFSSLQLPELLAQRVIQQARAIIRDRIEELESLTPQERLGRLRDITLDILAARATVKNFSSLKAPGTFVPIDGVATLYADALHSVTTASLVAIKPAPYDVLFTPAVNTTELDVTVDGAFSFLLALPGSYIARVESVSPTDWVITLGVNDSLRFRYDVLGAAPIVIVVSLPAGTYGPFEVSQFINAAINAATNTADVAAEVFITPQQFLGPVTMDAFGSPSDMDFLATGTTDLTQFNLSPGMFVLVRDREKYLGEVDIDATVGTTAEFLRPGTTVDFTTMGIVAGDFVIVRDTSSVQNNASYVVNVGGVLASKLVCTLISGPAPTDETSKTVVVSPSTNDGALYTIDVGGITATTLTCTHVTGVGPIPTNDATARTIEVGPAATFRIRFNPHRALTSLVNEGFIEIAPLTDVQTATGNTLGLFNGLKSTSRGVSAQTVVQALNAQTASSQSDQSKLEVSFEFQPSVLSSLTGRTDPTGPALMVVYRTRQRVNITTGGVSAVFTGAFADLGIVLGDQVTIRITTILVDQNVIGTVTAVTDTTLSATMASAVSVSSNVMIEVSPSFNAPRGCVVRVLDGPNQSDYGVRGQFSSVEGELTLVRSMPLAGAFSGQPEQFSVQVGEYFQTFASTKNGVDTKVVVSTNSNPESGALLLFTTSPVTDFGETTFMQLPEVPRELEVGDTLELYTTNYSVPALTREIVSIEEELRLIELSVSLSTDTTGFSFDFSLTIQPPFARIRKQKKNSYEQYKAQSSAYLALSNDKAIDQYFSELRRLTNGLLNTTNPTTAQVTTAVERVEDIIDDLDIAQTDLSVLAASPVPEVDALLRTYEEKGSTRGTDILLEGRFSDFFGLDQDEFSYAGVVLKGIKDVSREDLPIRKVRRNELADREVTMAEFEEPDFEFDQSDLDPFGEVDIPGEFFVPFKGEAF